MQIRFRRLSELALPFKTAYDGDAGLDIASVERVTLAPGQRAAVRTGIAIELPAASFALVLPRSGLARKHGVTLVNSPGLIDSGYRGEITVLLINTDSSSAYTVEVGERIAQLLPLRAEAGYELVEVESLNSSDRSVKGFGSSGS